MSSKIYINTNTIDDEDDGENEALFVDEDEEEMPKPTSTTEINNINNNNEQENNKNIITNNKDNNNSYEGDDSNINDKVSDLIIPTRPPRPRMKNRIPRNKNNFNSEITPISSKNGEILTKFNVDWYGNSVLHQCFGNRGDFGVKLIDVEKIKNVIRKNPEMPRTSNQFGRIPLHYAVDGTTKANLEVVKILLEIYPGGVCMTDANGQTPYDLAVYWKQPNTVLKALLDVNPSIDKRRWLKYTYGPLGQFYCWLNNVPAHSVPLQLITRINSTSSSVSNNLEYNHDSNTTSYLTDCSSDSLPYV
jgi:hypothetical protein